MISITQESSGHSEELTPGAHNVIRQALVLREKIFLPTFHIKLGLAKQFVKA